MTDFHTVNKINTSTTVKPPQTLNLKTFKKMMETHQFPRGQFAEHIDKHYLPLQTLHTNLQTLNGIVNDAIDCEKIYERKDFALLGFENKTAAEMNRLCNKQVFNPRDVGLDGKVTNFDEKRVVTIMNALLNHIGYTTETIKKRVRVDGKQIVIYSYLIVPRKGEDILGKMNTSFQNDEFPEANE